MISPQSMREAWDLALRGIPNEGYGDITAEEVAQLIRYPPIISFEHYQQLKALGNDIIKEEPELVVIKPNITPNEVFFYLTRGSLPDMPDIRFYVDRLYRFRHSVDPLIQGLLLMIYGTEHNYSLNLNRSPLEELLLAYNQVMGIDGLVRALASANDIGINGYNDADVGFVTEIEKRIV